MLKGQNPTNLGDLGFFFARSSSTPTRQTLMGWVDTGLINTVDGGEMAPIWLGHNSVYLDTYNGYWNLQMGFRRSVHNSDLGSGDLGDLTGKRVFVAFTAAEDDDSLFAMYLGDDRTPAVLVPFDPSHNDVGSGTFDTGNATLGFLDEEDQGFQQGWGAQIALPRVLSLAEIRDWQFRPRVLAGAVATFMPGDLGPVAGWVDPDGGGFVPEQSGKGYQAFVDNSDGAFPSRPYIFAPDPAFGRVHLAA